MKRIIVFALAVFMGSINGFAQEKLVEVIWEFRSADTLMRSPIDKENQDMLSKFPDGKPIKRVRGTDDFIKATQEELDAWLAANPPEPKPEPEPEPPTPEQEIADLKARITELETKEAEVEVRVKALEDKATAETRE